MTDLTQEEVEGFVHRRRSVFGKEDEAVRIAQALLKAQDALEEVEHCADPFIHEGAMQGFCPVCHHSSGLPHHPDCKLSQALPKKGAE